ncbi:DUF3418 domain-containing protein [Gleimia sp. 6138-11-ORH1]|uniref:DUF3418 domain-containing protein n=1 Tax=Gleimia sp. 6138-11-ORH1 TaxID=2973937 RepID=UPI0021674DF4|nr:DUF3418 domain-containing protein [Gleimia sp. 6138-11-ORH1]MCS4485097.1 DUF3418 domain-containing protein [Gleimia sp. 6138-11-ORH1]
MADSQAHFSQARTSSTDRPGQTHGGKSGGFNRRPRKNSQKTLPKKQRRHARKSYSPEQLAARAASIPVIDYPENLPVTALRAEIAAAIKNHQVVIVSGETGSGKTTQLPKICLQLGRGVKGLIGHTQPRRLAARAVASRIAEELSTTVGGTGIVGYQVRFTDEVSQHTLVKLMTDGILLAEIQNDPLLRQYDTIIIDEAHERSLNIDFLLGYLKQLLPKRKDLKVIITSATIDSQRFAKHFADSAGNPAPVIRVCGRTFPVEIRYRPLSPSEPPLPASPQSNAGQAAADNGSEGGFETEEQFKNLVLEDPDDDLALNGYGYGQDIDYLTALCAAVDELCEEADATATDRDILVFLPGERDIRDATNALKEHLGTRFLKAGHAQADSPLDAVEVVPLYSRLSAAEQQLIFTTHPRQRIVLATNVAETSLTVPGIKYVIDPGLARISRYSNRTKVQRLPIEPVSQASANQRSGRCGRVSDGICIRLYAQRDFDARPHYTEPEILRTSLASVILQMAALGLGLVEKFPFLDAPAPKAIKDGVALLSELGAITVDKHQLQLTKIGRDLAKLPIDPRLGRMLLESVKLSCASEVLVIVAALSMQDVRERPEAAAAEADLAHARFLDPTSDFLTYLNLWRYLRVNDRELSNSALRRLCKREFLHYLRFREWEDVVTQLIELAKPLKLNLEPLSLPSKAEIVKAQNMQGLAKGDSLAAVSAVKSFTEKTSARNADLIHQALLVGLLSNLGAYSPQKSAYLGARGTVFTIWPGSGLARKHYDWVMAAELVETSRLFARTVARIRPEWVEQIAPNLVKRSYSEPFWSATRGAALVREKVTIYGLTLTADKEVLLGNLPASVNLDASTGSGFSIGQRTETVAPLTPLTPAEIAREMFIRNALVENNWRTHHKFLADNQRVLDEIHAEEARLRTGGVVSEETIFAFYDERLPDSIVSATHFDSWWKRQRNKRILLLSKKALLPDASDLSAVDFPTVWRQGDLEFPLHYQFDPGSARDGVSVQIPLALLPRVSELGFAWLVPGMLEELLTAVIRGLPKSVRQQLVPAPDVARQIAGWIRTHIWGETSAEGEVSDLLLPSTENSSQADDPLSLEASLARLADWGAATGTVRQSNAKKPSPSRSVTRRDDHTTPRSVTRRDDEKPTSPPAEPLIPGTTHSLEIPDFHAAFTRAVRTLKGIDVPSEVIAEVELPAHLQFTYIVVDEKGKELKAGKDLLWLQKELAGRSQKAVRTALKTALATALEAQQERGKPKKKSASPTGKDAPQRPRKPQTTTDPNTTDPNQLFTQNFTEIPALTNWPTTGLTDDALPKDIDATAVTGLQVRAYPALCANPTTGLEYRAGTSIFTTLAEADQAHREGLTHLLLTQLALTPTRVTTRWSGAEALMLAASPYPNTQTLVYEAHLAATRALLTSYPTNPVLIRTRSAYNELSNWVKQRLEDKIYELIGYLSKALEASASLENTRKTHATQSLLKVNQQIKTHANTLINDRFFTHIPAQWLPHIARFIKADELRLKKAAQSASALNRDQEIQQEIAELAAEINQLMQVTAPTETTRQARLIEAKWLLEELRVSLFAQELGTSQKVSLKRLWNLLN